MRMAHAAMRLSYVLGLTFAGPYLEEGDENTTKRS